MNFKTNFLKYIFIVSLSLTTLFAKAQTPDTVLCANGKITLKSTVTSTDPVAKYEWYKNGNPISGATTGTYQTEGVDYTTAAYTVVAINTNGCSSDASVPFLVANAPEATPYISIADSSSCQTATNKVVLTGHGVPTTNIPDLTYTFEWKKADSVVGTGTTLTLRNVVESGDYTFTITPVWKTKNLSCAKISNATTVTIHPFAAPAKISAVISGYQTADEERAGVVCEFNTVTFTAAVISSTDPNITTSGLTYQWYKGGTALLGETTATLVLTSVISTNSGNYTVRTKTINTCEVTSNELVLDVKARLSKPTISF